MVFELIKSLIFKRLAFEYLFNEKNYSASVSFLILKPTKP